MQYEQRLHAKFKQHSKALGYCDSKRDEMAAAFFYGALMALVELEAEDWHPEAAQALQRRLMFVCLIGYRTIERALREAEGERAAVYFSETRPMHATAGAWRRGSTLFSKPEWAEAY